MPEQDVNTSENTSTEGNDTEEEETQKGTQEEAQEKTQEKTQEETKDTSGETAKEGEKTQSVPYSRFKEVNDAKKKLEAKLTSYDKEQTKNQPKATDEEWKERMEFVTNHDLGQAKKKKVDFLTAFAKGKGVSLEEAANMDVVKATFASLEEKVAKDNAVPKPSESGATHKKKKLSDLDNKEIREDFDTVAQKAIRAGKTKKRKELGI